MTTMHDGAVSEMQRLAAEIMERLDAVAASVGPEVLNVRVARAHALGLTDQLHELVGNPAVAVRPAQR